MKYNQTTLISVVGSNGGTGAAIIDELIIQGYCNINGITLSGKDKWGREVQIVQADFLDINSALKATENSKIIFGAFNASQYSDHSWAKEFPIFMDNFVQCGIANNAKLIFLDNVYSYKNLVGQGEYNEDTSIEPSNQKGEIRKKIFNTFINALSENKLSGVVIKSSDLYGPYALNSIIGDRYFESLFKKQIADILPLGNQLHSMTFTRDLGRIAVNAAIEDTMPKVIHTPNAEPKGYEDMVRMTYNHIKFKPKEKPNSMFMFKFLAMFIPPVKSMLGMMYQWNNKFVINSLYNPDYKPTELKSGIEETLNWFQKNI